MYSNKENVNILTALLVQHGVRHAVVCPGSRNAPIVHNLNECPDITCYPVTDERSAGFYALGLAQALNEPVIVCVTSGSALLNVIPAVAEAKYQRQSLVIISADRPQQWIDQLDGQTLPQPGVFGGLVGKCVSLPEIEDCCQADEMRWYCNRLINEALLALPACIHINVPITEPLFQFTTPELPRERKIERIVPGTDYGCLPPDIIDSLAKAQRPIIVFGQSSPYDFSGEGLHTLFSHVIVLHESLSPFPSISHFDEVLANWQMELPDFVIYVGGTIVSKRLKQFLRRAKDAEVWRINTTGEVEDTFQHLRGIIVGDARLILQSLSEKLSNKPMTASIEYRCQWLQRLKAASRHAAQYEPDYSQMATIREFERRLPSSCTVHYANSSAIRLANIYASHHVWCNRGVNGIEGSLSTAAGFSLCQSPDSPVTFCVIGDLSFFYDQNALWNPNLRANFRILLLNNGKGGIFNMLPGLEKSPARDALISAQHTTSAQGICQQNGVDYRRASNTAEMKAGIEWLTGEKCQAPMLLEVFTNANDDEKTLKDYYKLL